MIPAMIPAMLHADSVSALLGQCIALVKHIGQRATICSSSIGHVDLCSYCTHETIPIASTPLNFHADAARRLTPCPFSPQISHAAREIQEIHREPCPTRTLMRSGFPVERPTFSILLVFCSTRSSAKIKPNEIKCRSQCPGPWRQ